MLKTRGLSARATPGSFGLRLPLGNKGEQVCPACYVAHLTTHISPVSGACFRRVNVKCQGQSPSIADNFPISLS